MPENSKLRQAVEKGSPASLRSDGLARRTKGVRLRSSILARLASETFLNSLRHVNFKKAARLVLAGVLAACVPVSLRISEPGAAEQKSADAIVEALQKSYDATVDFVADFRQETEVKTLNRSLKAWGKVSFQRPAKMLWRYEEPKGQFVLADGKYVYFYQPEQNQIIKTPLKNAFRTDIPLSFLLGIGNLKKDFNAALKASEPTQYVLRMEPKGETAAGVGEILLGVSKNTADILWVSVRDASSNLTTIRLSEMRKGVGLKDSLFTLQIPKGVDLVELGQ